MKLYTKTRDDGSTGLFGGQRVGKDDLRVEAYGTVDELNACLGVALTHPGLDDFRPLMVDIQSRLFDVGADLATPHESDGKRMPGFVPRLDPSHIAALENAIDQASDALPAMTHFILPGGCPLAAHLHLARTVCRRAERLTVALSRQTTVNPDVVVYINRLSDLLFALARLANHESQTKDIPWLSPRPPRK